MMWPCELQTEKSIVNYIFDILFYMKENNCRYYCYMYNKLNYEQLFVTTYAHNILYILFTSQNEYNILWIAWENVLNDRIEPNIIIVI